jgi:tetratricopeptide (TPR) repeat protein
MCSSPREPIDFSQQLGAAKYLHGLGRLADAEKRYREILAQDQDNAEVMGLLAIAAQQQRNPKEAEKYWRRSLRVASPPSTFLRNLHNYLQALLEAGRRDEAAKVADTDIPAWPAVRIPEPGEREALLTLSRLLTVFGHAKSATRLLESVAVALPADATLLYELGRLQLHGGNVKAAFGTLSAADQALHPRSSLPLLSDLFLCASALGSEPLARAALNRIVGAAPVFVAPRMPGQKANVLVLTGALTIRQTINSERVLHFRGNYPAQLARALADEFRFSSVFSSHDAGRAAIGMLPKPDFIINNFANAECFLDESGLSEQAEFADSFGVPVINHPSKVAQVSRDRSAGLIADIPGVLVPKTRRFSKTGLTTRDLVAQIEEEFDYPLITRTLFSQEGKGMVRVEQRAALVDTLTGGTPDDFFVTEFVDSRGSSGLYRKIRAAVVDGEIILVRVDFDTNWNVHGRKSDERAAFYLNNRRLLVEEDRICADPARELGEAVVRSLEAIRIGMPLDVFGLDFDVAPDGRVVFFEANATMNLLSSARPDVANPRHAEERLLSAFRRYFLGLLGHEHLA